MRNEINLEETKANLQFFIAVRLAEFNAGIDFAKQGINLLFYANGGACVAVLAFIGALLQSNNFPDKDLIFNVLVNSLYFFVIGVILTLLTVLFSYFGQIMIAEANQETRENADFQKKYEKIRSKAILFASCAIFCPILGLLYIKLYV